jgi:pseudouridine-5'-phosphate glycosidase/pseudouridine kinase
MPAQPRSAASFEELKNAALDSLGAASEKTALHAADPPVDILVAGALAVDFSCDYAPISGSESKVDPALHTSNPAVIRQTLGGVAHNIAKAAHYLGSTVRLCSAIGDDLSGRAALSQLHDEKMITDGIKTLPSPNRTAQYVAINNANKDLTLAMADMSILESSTSSTISSTWLSSPKASIPKCVVVDANWDTDSLHTWLEYGKRVSALTIFEPVSTAKATRLFTPPSASHPTPIFPNHVVDIATPNAHELAALHSRAAALDLFSSNPWFRVIDALGIPSSGLRVPLAYTTSSALVDQGIPQQAIKLLPFIPTLLTKLGPQGVLLTQLLPADSPLLYPESSESQYVLAQINNLDSEIGIGGLYVRLFPPEKVLGEGEVVSVNGVGDTFVGALAAGLVAGEQQDRASRVQECVGFAQRAAGLSLLSGESVSRELVGLRR